MKLNKTRVGILSLCGILALAGVGGALAYVINETQAEGTVTTESAIYLDWGTPSVLAVENLNATEPQYREVVVDYAKSTNVSRNATVTFDLSDNTTAGIKVEVSDGVEWSTINLNPTAYEEQIKTLTYESEAAVYNLSDAKAYTYYLKFSYSSTTTFDANSISGTLTISLSVA